MILLDLKLAKPQAEGISARRSPTVAPAAPVVVKRTPLLAAGSKIQRFHSSERMLHWAIAIPFLVCYSTALIMVLVYNPAPYRPFRSVFSWAHRCSGIALMVLPLLAMWKGRRELGVHWDNVKQAWIWGLNDFKWMALMPLSILSAKIKLPEQGKFNAAEKVNFMVLMATYPLYILTGLLIWFKTYGLLAWALHFLMALIATPLIFGHMYMAMIDRGGRPGLGGMISGFVGREWARHHYPIWYREHYEPAEEPAPEEQDREACLVNADVPGSEP